MESLSIKQVIEKANEYDANLKANDPRFNYEVTLIHEDGTIQKFDSAFLMKMKDSHRVIGEEDKETFWVICFTEHYGTHVYHNTDLFRYWESERRRKPLKELK